MTKRPSEPEGSQLRKATFTAQDVADAVQEFGWALRAWELLG